MDFEWFKNEIHPIRSIEKAHLNSIECIDFNQAKPNILASGSHDKLIKIWDVEAGKELLCLKGHSDGVWGVKYSQDGNILYSVSVDKTVAVWDAKSGKIIKSLQGHSNFVYTLALSNDQTKLISGDKDGKIFYWDLKTMTNIKNTQEVSQSILYRTEFLTDNLIITTDGLGVLYLFDLTTSNIKSIHKQKFQGPELRIQGLTILPKSTEGKFQLLAGYSDKFLRRFELDPTTFKFELTQAVQAHFDATTCVTQQKDKIASGGRDGSGRIWNLEGILDAIPLYGSLTGHIELISQMAFMPKQANNQVLATCSWDQRINIYKI